jgi:hypothetical protein
MPPSSKRSPSREDRVAAGVEELSRFLVDLLRQGFASVSSAGYRSFDEMASRMVDAQAPGLARRVRDLGSLCHDASNPGDLLLDRLGRLHLLLEAYRRIDRLPPDLAADVRSLVGFTTRREAVLALPCVQDTWWTLGRRLEVQDDLSTSRAWLWGERSGRFALILSFSAGGRPFDVGPAPGTVLEGRVHFYPSAVPLRAILDPQGPPRKAHGTKPAVHLPLEQAWDQMLDCHARLPWLDRFPMALQSVVPARDGERWVLRHEALALPLAPFGQDGWDLIAVSGGHPVDVFGEWTGASLAPLACFASNAHYTLGRNPMFREVEG